MNKEYKQLQFVRDLEVGDTIRNKGSQSVYVVTAIYGARATAVRTIDVRNDSEWEVLAEKTK